MYVYRPLAHNVNLRDLPFYVKLVVMLRKTDQLTIYVEVMNFCTVHNTF